MRSWICYAYNSVRGMQSGFLIDCGLELVSASVRGFCRGHCCFLVSQWATASSEEIRSGVESVKVNAMACRVLCDFLIVCVCGCGLETAIAPATEFVTACVITAM